LKAFLPSYLPSLTRTSGHCLGTSRAGNVCDSTLNNNNNDDNNNNNKKKKKKKKKKLLTT